MFNLIFFILSIIGTALFYVFKVLSFNSFGSYFLPLAIWLGLFVAIELLFLLFLLVTGFFIKDKDYPMYSKFEKFLLDNTLAWICEWGRAKIYVRNKELYPQDKKIFLVCNHRSDFDPLIIGSILRKPHLAQISKKENFRIPIAGKHIRRSCYLPIDREDPRKALKTINLAASYIKDNKMSVGVFPEGTRNKTNEPLLEFKNGCLKIASKAECPILVCTLKNAELISKRTPFRRTKVYFDLIKVIPYEEIKDLTTKEIGEKIREIMLKDLQNN